MILSVVCNACGSVTHARVGRVSRVTVEHEAACPFWLAVERSPRAAQRWAAKHGYPIRCAIEPIAGAA